MDRGWGMIPATGCRFDHGRLRQAAGEVLRRARRNRGLTLQDVSRLTAGGFKASVLGGYDRAERTISLERFTELAQLYGVPADRLLGDLLARTNPEGRVDIVIDLNRLALLDEREVRAVAKFVHNVRTERGDSLTDVVSLRSGDVEALALSSGVAPRELLSKLRPALRAESGKAGGNAPQGR
jgi:transcriptional regulator with XRE-family HTH domain